MIVFDITNTESLGKAKNWVKELQRQGNPNMIMALAGNKADLGDARAVTAEEAQVHKQAKQLVPQGLSELHINLRADMLTGGM